MPLLHPQTISYPRIFCTAARARVCPLSALAHAPFLGVIDTDKHSLVSLRCLGSEGRHRPTRRRRESCGCPCAPSRSSATTIERRYCIEPSRTGGYRDKPDDSSLDEGLSGFFLVCT